MKYKQLYLPDTTILVTRLLTVDGVGELIDYMPIKLAGSATHQHHLMRSGQVVRGTLTFELIWRPAFNYARDPIGPPFHRGERSFSTTALV